MWMEEFERLTCSKCPHSAASHGPKGCVTCDCTARIFRIPLRGDRLTIHPYPTEFMGPDRRPNLSLS